MIYRGAEMKITYYALVLLFLFSGIILLREWAVEKKRKYKFRFRKHRFRNAKSFIQNNLSDNNHLFRGIGIPISVYQYNLLRLSILSIIIIFEVEENGISVETAIKAVVVFSLFIFTSPRLTVLGKKTPFAILIASLKRYNQTIIDDEIYKALSRLKNLVITQRENPMSASFLIEQITKFTKKTKGIFLKTLSMYHEGNQEEAIEFFKATTGTKLGAEFGNIMSKLDELNPAELKDQLILLQSSVRDEKVTLKLRQQELFSNLMFIPIVAASMAILLNFVIITVWLDSLNHLLNF